MRTRLPNILEWNESTFCYQIVREGQSISLKDLSAEEVQTRLQDFLKDVNSFRFCSRLGYVATLRKETRKRGGDYWIAYKKVEGKLCKDYAGKSADITIEGLAQIAQKFARSSGHEQRQAQGRRAKAKPDFKRRFNTDSEQPHQEQAQAQAAPNKHWEAFKTRQEQAAQAEREKQAQAEKDRQAQEATEREQRARQTRAEWKRQYSKRREQTHQERQEWFAQERERRRQRYESETGERDFRYWQQRQKHEWVAYRILWISDEQSYYEIDDDWLMSSDLPFTHHIDEQFMRDLATGGLHRGTSFLFGTRQGHEIVVCSEKQVSGNRTAYLWFAEQQSRRICLGYTDSLTFAKLERVAARLATGVDDEEACACRLNDWNVEYGAYKREDERQTRQQRERYRQQQEHKRICAEAWEKRYRPKWKRQTPEEEEKEHREYQHWCDNDDPIILYWVRAATSDLKPKTPEQEEALRACLKELAEYEQQREKWFAHQLEWWYMHHAYTGLWLRYARLLLAFELIGDDEVQGNRGGVSESDALEFMGFDHKPTKAELKRRYWELAKKYHPDVGGSRDDFVKLNNANERLQAACA